MRRLRVIRPGRRATPDREDRCRVEPRDRLAETEAADIPGLAFGRAWKQASPRPRAVARDTAPDDFLRRQGERQRHSETCRAARRRAGDRADGAPSRRRCSASSRHRYCVEMSAATAPSRAPRAERSLPSRRRRSGGRSNRATKSSDCSGTGIEDLDTEPATCSAWPRPGEPAHGVGRSGAGA